MWEMFTNQRIQLNFKLTEISLCSNVFSSRRLINHTCTDSDIGNTINNNKRTSCTISLISINNHRLS